MTALLPVCPLCNSGVKSYGDFLCCGSLTCGWSESSQVYVKHLSLDYFTKDQGQPCQQGEAASRTGCIPSTPQVPNAGPSPVRRSEPEQSAGGWDSFGGGESYSDPISALSDSDVIKASKRKPLELPTHKGVDDVYIADAWNDVSRLWPEMAATITRIGEYDPKTVPKGVEPPNAFVDPFTGVLAIKPGAVLEPETLWHELVHMDQRIRGTLKPRNEMEPDAFNDLEVEARQRAKQGQIAVDKLRQSKADISGEQSSFLEGNHDAPFTPDDETKLDAEAEKKAGSILSAVASLPGKAIPQSVKNAAVRVKAFATRMLAKRYGEKWAGIILKVAAISAPIPAPGSQPIAIAGALIIAESVRAWNKVRGNKAMDREMTRGEIVAAAKELLAEIEKQLQAASGEKNVGSYSIKSEGQPCEQGERATITGCIPADPQQPQVDPSPVSREQAAAVPLKFTSFDDGDRWGAANYQEWMDNLDTPTKKALAQYVSESSRMNGVLRGAEKYTSDKMAVKVTEERVPLIDAALASHPIPETVQAWRGVKTADGWDWSSMVGKTWTDEGYFSSSVNRTEAEAHADPAKYPGGAMLRVTIPKGTPGAYLGGDGGWSSEMELLLGRGLQYKVTAVHEPGSPKNPFPKEGWKAFRVVDVEVVPAETPTSSKKTLFGYRMKGEGQPCEQGEAASKTGCIPADPKMPNVESPSIRTSRENEDRIAAYKSTGVRFLAGSPPETNKIVWTVRNSVTDNDIHTLLNYTGGEYVRINANMRNAYPNFSELDEKTAKEVAEIEASIDAAPALDKPTMVYRGIKVDADEKKRIIEAAKKSIADGIDFQLPSITSATFDPNMIGAFAGGNGVVFNIVATKGIPVRPLSAAKHEEEFIISSKAKYRVVGADDSIVWLEQLS